MPGGCAEELWIEQSRERFLWLECADPAEDLPAIVPRHSDRSNFARPLVQIEVRGTAHIDASVGQVDCALGIVGKSRKEFLSHPDHLVGLFAHTGYLACHDDVLTVAEHSPKGVTR